DVAELFSVKADGSGLAKLNGSLVSGGSVTNWFISPDGSRVAYRADQNTDEKYEVFVTAIDGSGESKRLNGDLPANGSVERFQWAENGNTVLYLANQQRGDTVEL